MGKTATETAESQIEANTETELREFDLGSLDTVAASDEGAELQLVHFITGKKLPVYITLLGKHSTVFREIMADRVNQRIAKEAVAAQRGKEVDRPTAEEAEERAVELLAACTTGWRTADKPVVMLKGEELKFNGENAKKLYREMLWVREQVDKFIGDLENFIKG